MSELDRTPIEFYVLSSLRGTFFKMNDKWGWEQDLENATLFVSEEELRKQVMADLKINNLEHFRIDKYVLKQNGNGTLSLTKELPESTVKNAK